jgi:MFS family permease
LDGAVRRLLVFCSTLVLFDVTFYSAIAPLLPDYVSDLGLSKAEAGVLSAAYAAGTLIASLPAGLLATRAGPRRTVIGGLALLGASSFAFGFGHDVGFLDGARFIQGVAGALIWSGALTWLITASPPEKRGSVIGTALGTAVAGALIGPALGALAAEIGTKAVFGAVVVIAAVFALIATRIPQPPVAEWRSLGEIRRVMTSSPVILSTIFVAVPSLMFGAIEVLIPLRIDELGGGHVLIAAAFIFGAAIEATLAPLAGRYSDRVGRRLPFVAGLGISSVAMLIFAAATGTGAVVGALQVASLGAGVCFAPALTMLSETAEAECLDQGLAAGLSNMAWASGQVAGGLVGGAVADVAGFALPAIVVAAVLVATAIYALRNDLPVPDPQPAPG